MLILFRQWFWLINNPQVYNLQAKLTDHSAD